MLHAIATQTTFGVGRTGRESPVERVDAMFNVLVAVGRRGLTLSGCGRTLHIVRYERHFYNGGTSMNATDSEALSVIRYLLGSLLVTSVLLTLSLLLRHL